METESSTPAISVAMSVYNGERFLAQAIESIQTQTFENFEFLILNDGSTDSSLSIIKEYASKDTRIKLISRENLGLIASLNQLIDTARAPLIARMDSDDISKPDRLEKQYAFLQKNPTYGVIGCQSDDIDEFNRPWNHPSPTYALGHESIVAAIENNTPIFCHPAVVFRREIVKAVGSYHSAFRHCEDYDLWLRLSFVTRMANLPDKLICYRHSLDQVSSRHATEQKIGVAIAKLAYVERLNGRNDPTESLVQLPQLADIDAAFNQIGLAKRIRMEIVPKLIYSHSMLSGDGFKLLIPYLLEGGLRNGMWRTVLRLIRHGEIYRASKLAFTLFTK